MASMCLSTENFKLLKSAVLADLGDIPKSGHVDESLAASLGYRSYAALRTDLMPGTTKPARNLGESAFEGRMLELCPDLGGDPFWWQGFDSIKCAALIKTIPISAHAIEYRSRRNKAWRNLMVASINAGLQLRKFGLQPEEDFEVSERQDGRERPRPGFYEFKLEGLPVLAYVEEAGFEELSIYAMVKPTAKARKDILWEHNDSSAGAVWARCWFERRTGAWIQSSTGYFRCQRPYLDLLSGLDIEPQGFGDRGNIMM
jgi:hypothetical protein